MDRLKAVFFRNLSVKLVALLAAFVLWVFVMNDQNPPMEKTFSVPLASRNAPAEMHVTQDAEIVQITLRAPRSVFAETSANAIGAFVDLAGLEPGTYPLHVQTSIPQGLELMSATPENVEVTLDPILQKRMPVRLLRTGAPPAGLTVAGIEPDERAVTVVGPQSVVNTVAEVVGTVTVPGTATGDLSVSVTLWPLDEDGDDVEGVRVVPKTVSARVAFARSLSRKVVDVRPTIEGAVAPGFVLAETRVEPSRVELAGEDAAIGAVTALSTEPIRVAGLAESTERTVSLVLPDGVTVTNKMVTVRLVVKPK